MNDSSCRFIFADADVRGTIVRLEDSYSAMTSLHSYPPAIQSLLGEFLAAALLLSDTIKFEGHLILQANGQGLVRLLMAEATHEGTVRGIARIDPDAASEAFDGKTLQELLSAGTLTVTIDAKGRERYQSIVPLDGSSLSDCLAVYFQQSEQLSTRIKLATDQGRAAGMLIQQLPVQVEVDRKKRADRWETISILASTLGGEELLEERSAVLIRHLFANENIRLFPESTVEFKCSCSDERMASALVSLGDEELTALFDEQPELELNCEFCGAQYRMDKDRVVALTTQGANLH